jgi:hypothetical protein
LSYCESQSIVANCLHRNISVLCPGYLEGEGRRGKMMGGGLGLRSTNELLYDRWGGVELIVASCHNNRLLLFDRACLPISVIGHSSRPDVPPCLSTCNCTVITALMIHSLHYDPAHPPSSAHWRSSRSPRYMPPLVTPTPPPEPPCSIMSPPINHSSWLESL